MDTLKSEILYIEDNFLNRRLIYKMLGADYTVLLANDGRSGITSAQFYLPDIILLDINLPDMHGFEVVQHLKQCQQIKHIPIIALTANAMDGDRQKCLKVGFDSYIAKPIMRIELLNTIAYYLCQKT